MPHQLKDGHCKNEWKIGPNHMSTIINLFPCKDILIKERKNSVDFKVKKLSWIKESTTHEIFSTIDHILGHKASLNKYKKTEIIIWSQCNKIKTQ
jgi:hypothetical protein